MTILDRNFGNVTAAASTWTVTRSTGSFGTGTTLVVAILSNTIFNTPSGWTVRANNVGLMGIYLFDHTGAGEASVPFTCTAAGTGQWYAWELTAGSTHLGSQASEFGPAASTVPVPSLTPSAGDRHMLAVAGGNYAIGALTVASFDSSYTLFNGGRAGAGDNTLSANADRNVTANGSTAYAPIATFASSTSVSPRAAIHAAYINAASGDVTAPTTPTGLTVGTVTSTTADLSWTASTDAVGVTGYEIEIVGP